eukprot:PhM_4_TR12843/c0_g1_i1/m.28727
MSNCASSSSTTIAAADTTLYVVPINPYVDIDSIPHDLIKELHSNNKDNNNNNIDNNTIIHCCPSVGVYIIFGAARRQENVSRIVRHRPPPTSYLTLPLVWAHHAHYDTARRVRLQSRMAYLSTLGGGWAAVKNVYKALGCALAMYRTAQLLGDDATCYRCVLFFGYAHMWNGNLKVARVIFERELAYAVVVGDKGQVLRCQSALHQLDYPDQRDAGDIELNLSDSWNHIGDDLV